MLAQVPAPSALESEDDDRLTPDARFAKVRAQVAVVRALADQIEHLSRSQDADGLGEQLVEEMSRLGCRLREAAASFTEAPSEDSGVFARRT